MIEYLINLMQWWISVTGFLILVFTLFQLHLLFIYLFKGKRKQLDTEKLIPKNKKHLPFVTVQIPVYNERYVIERIIDTVSNLDYPSNKLEVQILDDSTDDTTEIIRIKLKELNTKNIHHIQRHTRKDFKAGALKNGLTKAKGDLILVFDADFIPPKDFLIKTVPYFSNSKLGYLQTRWQHLNRNYSLLTRLQSFGLDAHYTIQQSARNTKNYFSNFTGTAGIWRKECIVDAGNWSGDTLTEDLDLSYAAQLKGWDYLYIENIESQAELPPTISALKSQQHRWTKGAAGVARKHLFKVLVSKASIIKKLHSAFHLLYIYLFFFAFISCLFSIPLYFITEADTGFHINFLYLFCILGNACFFWFSFYNKKNPGEFIVTLPLFTSVLSGLLLNNSIAILEELIGKKSSFIRTPKFNVNDSSIHLSNKKYYQKTLSYLTLLEGLLSMCFTIIFLIGISTKNYSFVILHGMLALGFGTVFIYSLAPYLNALSLSFSLKFKLKPSTILSDKL